MMKMFLLLYVVCTGGTRATDTGEAGQALYNGRSVVNEFAKPYTYRRPGQPCVGFISINHVNIAWDPPEELFQDHGYFLRYKECSSHSKWKFYPETLAQPSVTLYKLKSGTQYVFQVRMIDDENEGPYSELSDHIETITSAAEHLLECMYDVEKPAIGLQLKRLPFQENKDARNEIGKTRKLELGDDKGDCVKEKTILLVGAQKTGKRTLVDGMLNYILGVKRSDPYRITIDKLEEDDMNWNVDQAVSQTQWISCYTIHPLSGGRLDYKLNIIDSSGFAGDKQIMQRIKEFFSRKDDTGVRFINSICFIIKAQDATITSTQMDIFNSYMSLFGQNMENNVSLLITFAGGKHPSLLSALKKANLPHEEYFPFNNYGLFADNSGSNESDFASMFWNMDFQCFQRFFERIAKIEAKCLRQATHVQSNREETEMTIANLMIIVDARLNRIEEIRLEIDIINVYKSQIEANSDFKYTVTETQQTQIDLPKGKHVTYCLNCNFTCHNICAIANDDGKKNCCVMDTNGFCMECPDKCKWNIHRNITYKLQYVSVKREKTYAEQREKYRRAIDETMTREKVVERMNEAVCNLEQEMLEMMKQVNEYHNHLRELTLRSDPHSLVEHIDILIKSENEEQRHGYQQRINALQHCRLRANTDRLWAGLTDTAPEVPDQVNLQVSGVLDVSLPAV